MSFKISLKGKDIGKLRRQLRRNGKVEKTLRKILARSLNETARQAKTYASRNIIRAELNVRAKDVKINVIPAYAFSSGAISATLKFEAKSLPIVDIPRVRQVSKGVSVQILKKKSREVLRSAFIEIMSSGHIGVFQRRTDKRLEIDERYTTTPVQIMSRATSINRVGRFVNIVLPKIIESKTKAFI